MGGEVWQIVLVLDGSGELADGNALRVIPSKGMNRGTSFTFQMTRVILRSFRKCASRTKLLPSARDSSGFGLGSAPRQHQLGPPRLRQQAQQLPALSKDQVVVIAQLATPSRAPNRRT